MSGVAWRWPWAVLAMGMVIGGCASTWTVPPQARPAAKASSPAAPAQPQPLPCLAAFNGACACGEAASDALQRAGITPQTIAGGTMERETDTQSGRLESFRFSVRPPQCALGQVYVRLGPTCDVRQVFSTGECTVEGVTQVRTKR